MIEALRGLSVILGMVTSLSLIWRLNWRWTLVSMAIQYLAVFWMVAQSWPIGLSLVKLVVGLVSSGVLASSLVVHGDKKSDIDLTGRIFRTLVILFIWLIFFYATPVIQTWLKTDRDLVWISMTLFGSGLIQLGMTNHPIRAAIGLLTFLAGFEVLYSALEVSVLVTGLLAVINLGISLVGAYLAALSEKEAAA